MMEVRQSSWDARAAANFIGGGAGGGLIVFAAVSGARGLPLTILTAAGIAFVAIGLACVFAEIGRPLRAMNVIRNARRSWMTRESLVAPALFVVATLAAYTSDVGLVALMALTALAFVYCQARILRAAKGIPAWREPRLVPLVVVTALTEGCGLLVVSGLVADAWQVALAVLVLARFVAWIAYRRAVASSAAAPALEVLDGAGLVLLIAGTLLPWVFLAMGVLGGSASWPAAAAGLLAAFAGSHFKFALVTRAGFNQGFALPHLPVRGARP